MQEDHDKVLGLFLNVKAQSPDFGERSAGVHSVARRGSARNSIILKFNADASASCGCDGGCAGAPRSPDHEDLHDGSRICFIAEAMSR